jgi:hypothetical protein
MSYPFLTPGLVQFHALQYLEQAWRVERETPQPAPRRRLRKAFGRAVGHAGRLLSQAADRLERSFAETPHLQGCG